MTTNSSPDNKYLDDRLAEYTDRLLSVSGAEEGVRDGELSGLEETLNTLKRTVESTAPDHAAQERMKKHLKAAYREARKVSREQKHATRRSFSILSFGFAGVAVALMVLSVMVSPLNPGNFSGVAGGDSTPTPIPGGEPATPVDPTLSIILFALAVGVVIIYFVFFWSRRKK